MGCLWIVAEKFYAAFGSSKKRLKVSIFIYRHLQGNPDQQRFTTRSGVLIGNDTSGAVQVVAAHCPNEDFGPRSLQLDRPTYAPAGRTMAVAAYSHRIIAYRPVT